MKNNKFQVLLLLIIFVTNFNDLYAKDKSKKVTTAVEVKEVKTTHPQVVYVQSNIKKHPFEAGINDEIKIYVDNWDSLTTLSTIEEKPIILYVNSIPVRDAEYILKDDTLSFLLHNEGDVLELWSNLLESRSKSEFFHIAADISVGLDGKKPIPVSKKIKNKFQINLVDKYWFWFAIVLINIIIGVFIGLAIKTDILRDTSEQPLTGRKPFSLARVQMAIWTLAILPSWLFLYVCLMHFKVLSDSTLILMGITASTGIGGLVMDAKNSSVMSSKGLFNDLVGNSLFRFQNLAWTLILVAVFARSVIIFLKMPEFDEKLLMLMGLSSGTYLGAKATEKVNAEHISQNNASSNNSNTSN